MKDRSMCVCVIDGVKQKKSDVERRLCNMFDGVIIRACQTPKRKQYCY